MDEVKQDKETLRDIIKTAKKAVLFAWKNEPKNFAIYIILIVISATILYLQLSSFSKIIDEVINIQRNDLGLTRELIKQSIILGIFFLIPAVLNNLESFYLHLLRNRVNIALNIHKIDKFSKLDIGTIENSDFQNKLEFALRWGIGSINNVLFAVTRSLRDIVALIVSASILFTINPLLIVIAVIGGIPGYFTAKKYQVKLFRVYNEQTEEARIIDDRRSFFNSTKKLTEILLFDIKRIFRNQINVAFDKHLGEVVDVSRQKAWAEFWEELFNTICLLGAMAFIISQAFQGIMPIGSLFLAFTTYRGFVSTTNGFFNSLSQIEEHTRYAIRWFDLFEVEPKIINKINALKPQWEVPPNIEFVSVSFKYPDTDDLVLKNFSFEIKSGEKIAFVGMNGAGKTTLVKLISRVYDPTEGQILINGVDLKDIDLDFWRINLGVLFQDFSNFQMSVREAIAISRPNEPIDDEKVIWAAEMSGATDFIEKFPTKYNQIIWKGFSNGVELSKGQFQRMAVARIFYRDALISILDEPTASIDAVAEEKIFESLEKKMVGKTVVLISHRFSTVKNADIIAVIEHGELVEIGSHKELILKNGRYAQLYSMQANRYLEIEK